MAEDEELQKWIAKRVRELDGYRIWWTGKSGRPTHVKLRLKAVRLTAEPAPTSSRRGTSLREGASLVLVPAPRWDEDEPDEMDSALHAILEADRAGADDGTIGKLWVFLLDAVGNDCNVIPSERTDRPRERLVVFPELVSVLYRHGRLRNPFEFCGVEPDKLSERETGICCALCEATKCVQECFSARHGWMNRIIEVRGNAARIKRAATSLELCGNKWGGDLPLVRRERKRYDEALADQIGQMVEREVTPCWERFVGAVGNLLRIPGAPLGLPELSLAGRRVAIC